MGHKHFARAVTIAALAALLAACQTPPPPAPPDGDRIVLLPQADGTPSAVIVHTLSGGEATLSQPYGTAVVGAGGVVQTSVTDADAVRARYQMLYDATPRQHMRHVLYFEFGGDSLTADSAQRLNTVLAEVGNMPAPEVLVTGHTDTVGTDSFNDGLSLKRARIVREQLIEKGVDAKRIEVVGRGRRELLVPTGPGVAEPRNRRVEIQVR